MRSKEKHSLENRKIIYNFIYKNSGLHLNKLFRKLNMNNGTIRYHLKYLEEKNMINNEKYER